MSVLPQLSPELSKKLSYRKLGIKTPDKLLFVSTNSWYDFFLDARESLSRSYGLELTLIEQIHLRDIVKECYAEQSRIEGKTNDFFFGFDVSPEAQCRFIHKCYGPTYAEMQKLSKIFTRDEIRAYFKRFQERAHLP